MAYTRPMQDRAQPAGQTTAHAKIMRPRSPSTELKRETGLDHWTVITTHEGLHFRAKCAK